MAKKIDLSKLPLKESGPLKKIGKLIATQMALQLLHDGRISVEGKSDDELRNEINSRLLALTKNRKFAVSIKIDHSDYLLSEARKLFRAGSYERSALFYATYFEHQLNWLIEQICAKKYISNSSIVRILRETNLNAKCTWVLQLLDHDPIQKTVLRNINDISEIRNSFIHYKWPVTPETESESESLLGSKMKKAESIVRFFRTFKERRLYKGHGPQVRRALRSKRKKS